MNANKCFWDCIDMKVNSRLRHVMLAGAIGLAFGLLMTSMVVVVLPLLGNWASPINAVFGFIHLPVYALVAFWGIFDLPPHGDGRFFIFPSLISVQWMLIGFSDAAQIALFKSL